MSEELQQDRRVASLMTPLGKDKLVLSRFEGSEGLSELFEFRVECLSIEQNIDFDSILGASCTVKMTFYDGPDRYFDGIAVEAQTLGMRQDLYVYRIVLRPSVWLMTRTSNCRIWHETTALDIIKDVLSGDGIDYRPATTRSYPSLEYCVQYRETDFAFVSRLMEQHGIYYFFEHSQGSHTMVLADAASSHKPVPGYASIRFTPTLTAGHIREQTLNNWSAERRFRTGKIELRDYNFKQPNSNMTGDATGHESYAKSQMEFYDYPGKYDDQGVGQTYAEVRLDAEQAFDHRRFATGQAANLFPGGLVSVQEHPIPDENRQYLLVRCSHYLVTEAYRSAGSIAVRDERPYHGDYEMQPSDRVFRAPIVTPKPTVYGPQTARVVARPGKDGEEIDVDEEGYGRVMVHFFWDRDDKKSCWIRVAQMWAGPQWGGQFIPRIGMEVVVDFLEGDPDRPLIVGAVYNGVNAYPYSLPSNKTQSGIKSDSSKGHGGYNEFMFEDKKDGEKIRMHAQKDHEVTILNLETTEIGEKYTDGGDSRTTTLINGGDNFTIDKGPQTTSLKNGSQTVTIQNGQQSTTVDKSITFESQGDTILLKTGASSIKLTSQAIEISSLKVTVTAPEIDHN